MGKNCPNCRLINPDSAEVCDCGLNFSTGKVSPPNSAPNSVGIGAEHEISMNDLVRMTRTSQTMDEFILKLAIQIVESQSHKPKSQLNLGGTLAQIFFSNLISLPFGRVSFGISSSRKATSSEICEKLNSRLYQEFSISFFSDADSKSESKRKKNAYRQFLDSLPESKKMVVANAALTDEKAYQAQVKKWLWEKASNE